MLYPICGAYKKIRKKVTQTLFPAKKPLKSVHSMIFKDLFASVNNSFSFKIGFKRETFSGALCRRTRGTIAALRIHDDRSAKAHQPY